MGKGGNKKNTWQEDDQAGRKAEAELCAHYGWQKRMIGYDERGNVRLKGEMEITLEHKEK